MNSANIKNVDNHPITISGGDGFTQDVAFAGAFVTVEGQFPPPQAGYELRVLTSSRFVDTRGHKSLWCPPGVSLTEVQDYVAKNGYAILDNMLLWGHDQFYLTGVSDIWESFKVAKNHSHNIFPVMSSLGLPYASDLGTPPGRVCARENDFYWSRVNMSVGANFALSDMSVDYSGAFQFDTYYYLVCTPYDGGGGG